MMKSLLIVSLALTAPLLAAPRGWVEIKPKVADGGASSDVRSEVRDAGGGRYAIKNQGGVGVVRWNGSSWQTLPLQEGNWQPVQLARLGKGVVCVWSQSRPEPFNGYLYRLSAHNGATSRWLHHAPMQAQFSEQSLYGPQFLPTGAAQLLIINQHDFYHLAPDGKVERVFTLTRDKMQRHGSPQEFIERTNALQILDDKRGGYWFWSNVWENGEGAYSLRGLLHWDGRKLRQIASFGGLSLVQSAVNALSLHGEKHLLLALGRRGLFEVDRATLQTRRVPDPAPNAFLFVQQITPQDSDLFVVGLSHEYDSDKDITARTAQLWRRRDGQWQRLIDGLDRWTNEETNRPILSNASGVWIPCAQGGVWLAPPHAAPVLLDWRYGLPMRSVSKIEAQKDGSTRIEGWGTESLTARIVNVPVLLAQRPTPRVKVFLSYLPLAQESGGRIWTVLNLRGNALSEWNGTRWIGHRVPQGYKLSNANALAFDRRHRVWIHSDNRDSQVAIFNRAVQGVAAWQVFPNYRAALLAQLGAKPPALPQFYATRRDGEASPSQTPDFANGRLCYLDLSQRTNYFDGQKWRRWTAQQISPKADTFEEPQVYFDAGGTLCVSISNVTWQLTSERWRRKSESKSESWSEETTRYSSVKSTAESAPKGVFDESNSSATATRDRQGFYFAVFKGQLFRITPDGQSSRLLAPLFGPHENHPFADGRTFAEVYFDGAGNTFFDTGDNEIVFFPSPPPPNTQATAHRVGVDAFDITASTTAVGPHWLVWRRGGGAWSAPQAASKIELRELPGGSHRVEVAVIDRFLYRDPTPAVVTLQVHLDPQAQITDFIADLSSPDYLRREKAVAGLARQPERALPALHAAIAEAQDDASLRWWLEAAIQEIEKHRSTQ